MHWLGDNPWAAWLVVATLLGLAELLSVDFALLMLAGGALAGAAVAAVAPGLLWLQVVCAAIVAGGLLGTVRPQLKRRLSSGPGYRSALQKLVGSTGVATREVSVAAGEVKVNGETWSARTMPGAVPIPAGHEVEVYEVEGATLVVYPTSGGELVL